MAISYRIEVAQAGTPERGPDAQGFGFVVEGDPNNTKPVYVYDSNVNTAANGYALGPGQQVEIRVSNLNALWFDVEVNGEAALVIRQW
jgi:cold shock CspA family protein